MDGALHHAILRAWVDRGFPPTTAELAAGFRVEPAEIVARLARLAADHGVVLHPGSDAIWIAHPFAAAPTPVYVERRDGRGWWAPCTWCATGIVALAAPDAVIHARAGGEATPLAIRVEGGAPVDPGATCVHFPLPARDAWDNVVHWCATVQPFAAASDVPEWSERHRLPVGAIVPLAQAFALGRAWYGRHLDESWRKWTVAEAQDIFAAVGMTGDIWRLPVREGTF
jgi:hypothetical protein